MVQIILENQAVDEVELSTNIKAYLKENPQGSIIVKADRSLPYSQVKQLLEKNG